MRLQSQDGFEIAIWFGTMKIPSGPELRFVFEIFPKADGGLKATLVSLDQGGTDVPIDELTFADNILRLEVKSVDLVYEGELQEDGATIVGEITQAGGSLPLEMMRVDEVPGFPRPQAPRRPYPYAEEEVMYENKAAGIRLAGTLTRPRAGGPFPAVLLISGSGAQDRDAMLFYHRPFLVLADYLTRRGIAVLRVDDRGWGASTGDFWQATSEDFAGDVRAGVEYLKRHEHIDPTRIGLVGHSEGGMIAPMVAAQSSDVAFIVLMAGPGVDGAEVLLLQLEASARADGGNPRTIAAMCAWYERMFSVVNQEPDDAVAAQRIREMYAAQEDPVGWSEQQLEVRINAFLSPWNRYFLSYDPAPVLTSVEYPVLAINGEKDVQVTPKENLSGIEEALRASGNQDVTVMELPGLNHLFQTAETGAVSEYINIAETMSPIALEIMAEWIAAHTRQRSPITFIHEEQTAPLPQILSLEQNAPNPFNPQTTIGYDLPAAIGYDLPAAAEVRLYVYNVHGQLIRTLVDGHRQPGSYTVEWDGQDDAGRNLASGTYLYRLKAGGVVASRKALLLR